MHRALLSALISTVFFSFVAAWGQINSISQPSTTTPSGPSVTTTAVGEAAGPQQSEGNRRFKPVSSVPLDHEVRPEAGA